MLNTTPERDPRDTPEMAEQRARIDTKHRAWNETLITRDRAAFASNYAQDGVLVIPAHPPVRGRATIEKVYGNILSDQRYRLEIEHHGTEIAHACDYAASYGISRVTGWDHPGVTGRTGHKGNFVTVYERQSDGRWYAVLDVATPEKMQVEARESADGSLASSASHPVVEWNRAHHNYAWDRLPIDDDRVADVAALRAMHDRANASIVARDAATFVDLYAEDALQMNPGLPLAKGRASIRNLTEQLVAKKDYALDCNHQGIVVSRSRDFAFAYGETLLTLGSRRYPATFVTVYRKQDDGAWRAVLDCAAPTTMRDDVYAGVTVPAGMSTQLK